MFELYFICLAKKNFIREEISQPDWKWNKANEVHFMRYQLITYNDVKTRNQMKFQWGNSAVLRWQQREKLSNLFFFFLLFSYNMWRWCWVTRYVMRACLIGFKNEKSRILIRRTRSNKMMKNHKLTKMWNFHDSELQFECCFLLSNVNCVYFWNFCYDFSPKLNLSIILLAGIWPNELCMQTWFWNLIRIWVFVSEVKSFGFCRFWSEFCGKHPEGLESVPEI